MFRWIITLVFATGLQLAAAQDPGLPPADQGDEQATAPIEFVKRTSAQYGFSIDLPASGVYRSPDDPDWAMDPEIAMVWEGVPDDPVNRVELRVDTIGEALTPGQFDSFYNNLLSYWANEPKKFTVTRHSEPPYRFGSMDWSIIEVVDHNSGDSTVNYTIFVTYDDKAVYSIGFYYLTPVSKAVQDMAVPMMKSFKIIN